jgi:hypothetical protein
MADDEREEARFMLPDGEARVRVENGRLAVRVIPGGGAFAPMSIIPEGVNAVSIGIHKAPRKRKSADG